MSKIEDMVCSKLQYRAKMGLNKYGTSMERTDLTYVQWLQHAQEEALDLAVYLQKLIILEIGKNKAGEAQNTAENK